MKRGAAYANDVGRMLCDLGCNVFIIDAAALAAQTPAGAPRMAPSRLRRSPTQ